MGADQTGYLFTGPVTLSQSKATLRAAATRAQRVLDELRNLRAAGTVPTPLPAVLRHLCQDDVEDALHAVASLPEPGIAVRNLLDWWSGGARDTAVRRDPADPKRIIGFAGDRTWGDEPNGVGYRTFKEALILDILSPFGIR